MTELFVIAVIVTPFPICSVEAGSKESRQVVHKMNDEGRTHLQSAYSSSSFDKFIVLMERFFVFSKSSQPLKHDLSI